MIFHFLPSDTIFIMDKQTQKVSPWITIDFGAKGYKENLSRLPFNMHDKYIKSHFKYAGYISDVAIYDSIVFFVYRYYDREYHVLYNMNTGHTLNGTIVDDLFNFFPLSKYYNGSFSKAGRGFLTTYMLDSHLTKRAREVFPDINIDSIESVLSNSEMGQIIVPTFKNF